MWTVNSEHRVFNIPFRLNNFHSWIASNGITNEVPFLVLLNLHTNIIWWKTNGKIGIFARSFWLLCKAILALPLYPSIILSSLQQTKLLFQLWMNYFRVQAHRLKLWNWSRNHEWMFSKWTGMMRLCNSTMAPTMNFIHIIFEIFCYQNTYGCALTKHYTLDTLGSFGSRTV